MQLEHLQIPSFKTISGHQQDIPLSYQLFGAPLGKAPVVLVNHALTGNSNVAGDTGWWSALIGDEKCIDTKKYTVLSFNVPGNGYDGFQIENYKDFVARDIAELFLIGLKVLKIEQLYALIGGSLGGGIGWEMLALAPTLAKHFIPVATDWKATDWMIANCQIQELFLSNSKNPVHDARIHAMLCYRTPESFKEKFQRSTSEEGELYNVESWLLHHGKKLQERFQLSAYKLMNQLLKTIDITRDREEKFDVLERVQANIHIVAVDSDLFFTAEENRETQRILAQTHANVTYGEISSLHGHDAFLIEFEQLERLLYGIFHTGPARRYKVLKFGGRSLANGTGIHHVQEIILNKAKEKQAVAVVVSARGDATDKLLLLLETAKKGLDYAPILNDFIAYQQEGVSTDVFITELKTLTQLLEGVKLLGDYTDKIKDKVLAQGELISAKYLAYLLQQKHIGARPIDSRTWLKTDAQFGSAHPLPISKELLQDIFNSLEGNIPVITGFIGSTEAGETTTLGRNGSNYSAALVANYIDAEELQNFTHVDGIYTANPDLVPAAKKIAELSYSEANEMANFGASILHAKTIIPLLEKNIPLRICNTFNAQNSGTLIRANVENKGIRAISVLDPMALLQLEGRGLLGKVGVDARIFSALGKANVSVSIIAQGSSERGIGLVVRTADAQTAASALNTEFKEDIKAHDVNAISYDKNIAVLSIIGQDLSTIHQPLAVLARNQITPLLLNNTVTGNNVCLVVKKPDLHKALHVIHGEIFSIGKRVNLFVFGKGLVGEVLIQQLLDSQSAILKRKNTRLNIVAVANSTKVWKNAAGIKTYSETDFQQEAINYQFEDILAFAKNYHLENCIAIDVTASKELVQQYIPLVENGFDLVSANKIGNTIDLAFYENLRAKLLFYKKDYLYETNVGAGLPLIDTIKLLHHSGENITKIRGVFSGSLSFLFNSFSKGNQSFSKVLEQAIAQGYTEPDPREDLCGNDVGRKLLILARELDLKNEFADVHIENLIPEPLRAVNKQEFLQRLEELNKVYNQKLAALEKDEVLRYVGELSGDLSDDYGAKLEVKLIAVSMDTALGQLQGADSIFEIYTESYGSQPLIVQGAGAGAAVTARGVFGDILRLTERI
ncbi:MAG: bifunctional aspartate kinase/homoserine dehydrogenase I [Flavobacteriaceae bacterium]|nr:bifunctional aspartate kinase/homoserine dehydrogenase I [Flavobacteriaceae bacterium]